MRKITPIPPILPPNAGKGLGEKIVNTLAGAFVNLYNALVANLSDRIRRGVEQIMHDMEARYSPLLQELDDNVQSNPLVPGFIKDLVHKAAYPESQFEVALAVGAVMMILPGIIQAVLQPLLTWVTGWVDRGVRSKFPPPGEAIPAYFRMGWERDRIEEWLEFQGYPEDMIEGLFSIMRPRLGSVDLVEAFHRGQMSWADVETELTRQGYDSKALASIQELAKRLPGPGDLVRMAVREAWRDDVAARWGYDQDFPSDFGEWLSKQGYSPDWAKKYWRAHWELPSVTMGMELLYRRLITEGEFNDLLRISDIPEVWRDLITQAAYRTYTRVDVRRMYGLGVLDEQGIYDAYRDFGYDHERAMNMTQFTILYETETEKQATRTDIERAFKLGMISEGEAKSWLVEIGYSPALADFYIARIRAEQDQSLVKVQINTIEDLYTHSEISEGEARTRLTGLGLVGKEIDVWLEQWRLSREAKVNRPSRATLERFFLEDIITQREFMEGLGVLGYQPQYQDWYLQAVVSRKEREAREDEKEAREEQEAIAARKARTTYQAEKAQLDVDLAEIRTAIAETQGAIRARTLRYHREYDLAQQKVEIDLLEREATRKILSSQAAIQGLEGEIAELNNSIDVLQSEIAALGVLKAEQIESVSKVTGERRIAVARQGIETNELEIAEIKTQIAYLETVLSLISGPVTRGLVEGLITTKLDTLSRQLGNRERLEVEVVSLQYVLDTLDLPLDQTELQAEVSTRKTIVAEIGVTIQELYLDIAGAELGQLDLETAELKDRVALDVLTKRRDIEIHQDSIAESRVGIETYQLSIAETRQQLQEDITALEQVQSLEEVNQAYQTDLDVLYTRLEDLRANQQEIQEAKALLTFEYREAEAERV